MATIEQVITSGVFSLDGQDFDVDNNVWLVGDENEVLVVDAAHDAQRILEAVRGRRVVAVVCTHGHNDHINAAAELADAVGAPIALHPDDQMLWQQVYADRSADIPLSEGESLSVAEQTLQVLHTPGHSPGGICLYDGEGHLFTGDTLFQGGPGATGRSFSDFSTIVESIRDRLLTLPNDTVVYTGHGDTTTVGAEKPHLDEWIARGH